MSLRVSIALTDSKLANWNAPRLKTRKPSRQREHSDHAIDTAITVSSVSGLACRQTEGVVRFVKPSDPVGISIEGRCYFDRKWQHLLPKRIAGFPRSGIAHGITTPPGNDVIAPATEGGRAPREKTR